MTYPRFLRAEEQSLYQGRFSTTRTEEQEVIFASGETHAAMLYRVIDINLNPELLVNLGEGSLNLVTHPQTGERIRAELPVVVHDPEPRLLFLILPEARRADEIRLRMDFLAQLAEEGPDLPGYVRDFIVDYAPFGPDELARYRESLRLPQEIEQEARRLSAVAQAQAIEQQRLRQWAVELADAEHRFKGGMPDGESMIRVDSSMILSEEETSGASGYAESIDSLSDRTPTLRSQSPYFLDGEEVVELSSDEIELVEDLEYSPSPLSRESLDVGGDSRPRAARARHASVRRGVHDTLEDMKPLPVAPEDLPVDLADLPLGQGRPFLIGEGGVSIHFVVESARSRTFTQCSPDILLQLHRLPSYPIVSILLVARDASEALVDELICVFDIERGSDRDILDRLQREFRLDVYLYDEGGSRVQYLQYAKPLEQNLDHIRKRAAEWSALLEPEDRDFEQAVRLYCSDGFERIGAQKHGFHQASFGEINSATTARLAVSIVGYWSEDQNGVYLIENRSFPLVFFRQIQRRVIEGALRFGVFLPFELRERAIEIGLAESHASLVGLLVHRFRELIDEGRSHDLDSVAQSENWEQLSTACADLGLVLDDHSRELARSALRRSRQLRSSPGVSLLDIQDTDEYQRVSSVTQASDADLRDLLQKGGMARIVTRELLSRGGETNILCVIESARVFDEQALEATARILAAGAAQFEPALLIGLGREHPSTVHLCALALALAKRIEALPTLIERMHDPRLSRDVPLREIVAQYGADAIDSLFEAIEQRGATDYLVEVLALISVEHGSDIIATLRENPSAVLLDAAQKMTAVRRRLGGRIIRSLAESEDEHSSDEPDDDGPATDEDS